MPDVYLVIVALLFILAVSDLIVGVSNDAVNFLNSAIGSRVATRRTIMIVASFGILVGATFSSGMMEVARKGIFNPQFFTFADIMAIFLAVMITDIILLDTFSTFGMPTSTTVSIVFELLGAAVMVALIKVLMAGDGISTVGQYINGDSALLIVSGIFLSVFIAFIVGALVMYVSRLLFTFQFRARFGLVGALWSGLALSAMTYFLLIKGAKGASFLPAGTADWAAENSWLLVGASFAVWSVVVAALMSVFKFDVLRFLVLVGTFSLAMAFAGNDLVNFIGVPVAGFESFQAWQASGQAPDEFSMEILSSRYPANTVILLCAGMVMIVTLWLSRKARSVTDTSVNLSRQSEGLERFSPSWIARVVVRRFRGLGQLVGAVVPNDVLERAEKRFAETSDAGEPDMASVETTKLGTPPAAFDLIRAAVNLTVASALIAVATSYKLPLSTTYVSFMVAMGTSLADRAWGRESAVYRVAGVLNVIGGWFATAAIAFTVSGTFAFVIHRFGLIGIVGLVALAVFLITRTFLIHKRREQDSSRRQTSHARSEDMVIGDYLEQAGKDTSAFVQSVKTAWHESMEGLRNENLADLRRASQAITELRATNDEFKYSFYNDLRRLRDDSGQGGRLYVFLFDLQQDMVQSIELIVNSCRNHIENSHVPFDSGQSELLADLEKQLDGYLDGVIDLISSRDETRLSHLMSIKTELLGHIESALSNQVGEIRSGTTGERNSLLFMSLLLETKDLVAVSSRLVKLYHRALEQRPDAPLLLPFTSSSELPVN